MFFSDVPNLMITYLPISLISITLSTVSAFILYTITKTIYRLFFHPLSSFPGPRLAAATFLYEAYFDVWQDGQFIFHLERLHDQYGPVIRVSPEEIHVRDSEWFDVLYTGPGHVRDKWARANRANGSPGAVASATSHDHHRLRRGALNQFFSKRAIDEMEDGIRAKVGSMCDMIEREYAHTGKALSLGTVFTALTMDVITSYCFGKSQDCLTDPDFAPKWKHLMTAIFNSTPISKHFPIVPKIMSSLPRGLVASLVPEMAPFFEAQDTIHAQANAIYQEETSRIAGMTKREAKAKTIFHGILQSDLPAEEKTIQRMSDEAFVLIVAGAETTAQVLTVMFAHILQNPTMLRRLRAELDTIASSNGELPPSRLFAQLPLCRATVQEGLRLAGPVTNRPILIAPSEDLRYASDASSSRQYIIPRGTPISMTLRDVLADPVIFPSPSHFNPDRWIEASAQGIRLDRFLVTFSKGSRACIGMNLSQSELYLALAAVVGRFDLKLGEGFDWERDLKVTRDHFVGWPGTGARDVVVEVEKRAS